jgi:hypothetical protein
MDHLRVDPGAFQIPGMHPPPLMNQPPQIFGAYHGHDGLSVLPPELAAQMGFDPSALLDDVNEAKRRRIARVSSWPFLSEPAMTGSAAHLCRDR